MSDSASARVTVGTRGSTLAVRQTNMVVDLLKRRYPDSDFRVTAIQTRGDLVPEQPISDIGDKGVFVRAIERALLDGDIDIAVHSLKDVPADVETSGLQLSAFVLRADARDVLVSRDDRTLADLAPGSRIGTSSLRRKVQMATIRPDLEAVPIRGNVDTRLRTVDAGEYDAVILAAAGLERLDLKHRISEFLSVDAFVPDAGQGTLGVQTRIGDQAQKLVAGIDDSENRLCGECERAVVRTLGAGCRSPVGAYASLDGDRVVVRVMAATGDGSRLYRFSESGPADQAGDIGTALGLRLLRAIDAG